MQEAAEWQRCLSLYGMLAADRLRPDAVTDSRQAAGVYAVV